MGDQKQGIYIVNYNLLKLGNSLSEIQKKSNSKAHALNYINEVVLNL